MGSGIRNINKYLKVYSGGKPGFHEADIFTLIVPKKKQIEVSDAGTHQDTNQDTHQDKIEALIEFCRIPRSGTEMQEFLWLKDKNNFKNNYLVPLLDEEVIRMTIPDKPTSKNQKYIKK